MCEDIERAFTLSLSHHGGLFSGHPVDNTVPGPMGPALPSANAAGLRFRRVGTVGFEFFLISFCFRVMVVVVGKCIKKNHEWCPRMVVFKTDIISFVKFKTLFPHSYCFDTPLFSRTHAFSSITKIIIICF